MDSITSSRTQQLLAGMSEALETPQTKGAWQFVAKADPKKLQTAERERALMCKDMVTEETHLVIEQAYAEELASQKKTLVLTNEFEQIELVFARNSTGK